MLPRQDLLAQARSGLMWLNGDRDQGPALFAHEAFKRIDMLQMVVRGDGAPVAATRSPIRVDGERALCPEGAPRVGGHAAALKAEFGG